MITYNDWIARAKSAYKCALVEKDEDIFYEDLCYQLQQSVEKAIKGLLIYYGVDPEFTHSIGKLLVELKKHTEIPEYIMETSKLTDYAVETRYPGDYVEISKEEYEKAIVIANDCLNWVENQIAAGK